LNSAHRPQLQLEQVSLSSAQGTHRLLQDISWEIYPGDRWGVIGPSGAGKTSLLRLLNRLIEPTTGTLYLEGQPLRDLPSVSVRQQVTLVPQEPRLLGMTVAAALAYPLKLRGVAPAAIQAQVATTMEQLQIPQEWLPRTEHQLSVGQRQWVAIARALVTQPTLLLLDEPTSALDTGRVDHLVRVLAQSSPTTLVLVSHQLEFVQQVCDQILYLERGKIGQRVKAAEMDWVRLREVFHQEERWASEWG
jgi:D-methionine transport system ATP-binding protein